MHVTICDGNRVRVSLDPGASKVVAQLRKSVVEQGTPGIQGVPGAAGAPGNAEVTVTLPAGENLLSNQVVCLRGTSQAFIPDLTNAQDVAAIIGVTKTAALGGTAVTILVAGNLFENLWSWSPGRIFCAAGGQLSQVVPTAGAICEVARAVTSQSIAVGIRPALLLE